MPGPTQILIILAIVLLIFGPKNLPKLARIFGGWFKEVKDLKAQLPTSDDFDPNAPDTTAKTKKPSDD